MASRSKLVDARWKPMPEKWEPMPENRKPFNIKECVFRVLPYAGLNLVLFWWQQADLLADKAAVPAMWVCAILMGAGIGRCIRGR